MENEYWADEDVGPARTDMGRRERVIEFVRRHLSIPTGDTK